MSRLRHSGIKRFNAESLINGQTSSPQLHKQTETDCVYSPVQQLILGHVLTEQIERENVDICCYATPPSLPLAEGRWQLLWRAQPPKL